MSDTRLTVAKRTRAGVGGGVGGKFAIKLGKHRDAVVEAKLGAGRRGPPDVRPKR